MHTTPKKNIWHIIIGGTIGNLAEWYNFLLYGYLASIIAQLFFPAANKFLSLTLTFTLFAISFLMRPIGGLIFGWIGDTYGRQRALVFSLIAMGIPTFLIGCLPTYNQIGIISPILLCILRIFQGLSVGGEHTGSAVYIAEHSPTHHRALWVSIIPTTAALGVLISSAAALVLINSFTHDQLLNWGWRVGYWAGALFCVLSIFLRINLPETSYFQKLQQEETKHHYPITLLLKNHETLKNLMIVFILTSTWGICYQILYIWMPTYFMHILHLSNNIALKINTFGLLLFAFLIMCVGYYADFISRKRLLIYACLAIVMFAYPLFKMLSSGALSQIYIAMGIFTVIFSLYIPTSFVIMVELFSTKIRYTGLSLGFNLGLALFGGTCPLIAMWLIRVTKNTAAPAFYMIFSALLTLLISRAITDRREQPL